MVFSPNKTVGNLGEELAKQYLCKQGLRFVEQQFVTKAGEIDLIMTQQQELVFVEVRLRENDEFGEPFESVTVHKQRKLIRTATCYLQFHRWTERYDCRFDVISILGTRLNYKITWIPNAFRVE